MSKAVSCIATYGKGGLGRHLKEIVDEVRNEGRLTRYYTSGPVPPNHSGYQIELRVRSWLKRSPLRYSLAWLSYLEGEFYDRAVANHMIAVHEFEGFGGQALHSFKAAQNLECECLSLQAANSHVNNVKRLHQKAIASFGIESSWLNEAQRKKTLEEYDTADIIYVASEYTRKSFLEAGISENKLRRRYFQPHPRYKNASCYPEPETFRIVYIGSLTVAKGIPILLEAFSRLRDKNAELVLVGGWTTRGMRKYVQRWLATDTRIKVSPGDPLPHLQKANVCVHPSYEDGFAYAPMEALACGVPVIVTEDTGMKEYVQDGINGYVVPTGSSEAIFERLVALRERPLAL